MFGEPLDRLGEPRAPGLPLVKRIWQFDGTPRRRVRISDEMLLRANAIWSEQRNAKLFDLFVAPPALPTKPLVVEPVVNLYKEYFAYIESREGTVQDPLGKRKETGVIVLNTNQLDHRLVSVGKAVHGSQTPHKEQANQYANVKRDY
jgi:hypothetical protein